MRENRIEGKKTLSINNAIISSCDMRGRGIIIAELIAVRIVRKKKMNISRTSHLHIMTTSYEKSINHLIEM